MFLTNLVLSSCTLFNQYIITITALLDLRLILPTCDFFLQQQLSWTLLSILKPAAQSRKCINAIKRYQLLLGQFSHTDMFTLYLIQW